MAELTDMEYEWLNPAEEHSAAIFREVCQAMGDRMLFLCLKVIVPIA